MGKNNKLINTINAISERNLIKAVEKASDDIVPQIYAAVAMALHRECGWGYTRINRVFEQSQEIWENFGGKMSEMVKLCEEETGISLVFGKGDDAKCR